MNRRFALKLMGATSLPLLAGCVGISSAELQSLGSKVTKADVDFAELYKYGERSHAAYLSEGIIRASYPATVRVAAPGKSGVRYFLEIDENAKTQVITVRGTANEKNLNEDFDIKVREDAKFDIPVHDGFDKDARAVYLDVKPYLKQGYKTYVTGHSLGGAVAALVSIYAIEDGQKVERVITFGQPRFTTAKGVERLGFLPIIRVVDENDIIPMVPPATAGDSVNGPYEHVGPEVILLEGPHYVYLPSHDATRIAIGEFWRELGVADLKDHDIKKYLARLASKSQEAVEVPYDQREKYAAKKQ